MAKEFKHFDTMFSKAEIEAVRKIYLEGATEAELAKMNSWDLKTDYWHNSEIRQNVYMLEDSVRWQNFRVAMKGVSTRQKLFMLNKYYVLHGAELIAREKCRVDNYIGALVRGGQLSADGNLTVQK